ncbi:hypothetical protein C0995_000693 [Termitomyces sp. Mi166|nr:hypothetical protein C0995_000693 [Termitomyces sp. Mi166\
MNEGIKSATEGNVLKEEERQPCTLSVQAKGKHQTLFLALQKHKQQQIVGSHPNILVISNKNIIDNKVEIIDSEVEIINKVEESAQEPITASPVQSSLPATLFDAQESITVSLLFLQSSATTTSPQSLQYPLFKILLGVQESVLESIATPPLHSPPPATLLNAQESTTAPLKSHLELPATLLHMGEAIACLHTQNQKLEH